MASALQMSGSGVTIYDRKWLFGRRINSVPNVRRECTRRLWETCAGSICDVVPFGLYDWCSPNPHDTMTPWWEIEYRMAGVYVLWRVDISLATKHPTSSVSTKRENYEHILKHVSFRACPRDRTSVTRIMYVEESTNSESYNQTDLLPKASETERLQGGLGEILN